MDKSNDLQIALQEDLENSTSTNTINDSKALSNDNNVSSSITYSKAKRIRESQFTDNNGNLQTPSSHLFGLRQIKIWREVQELILAHGGLENVENKIRLQYPNRRLEVDFKIYILKRYLLLDEYSDKSFKSILKTAEFLNLRTEDIRKLLYDIKYEMYNGLYINPIILEDHHIDRLQKIYPNSIKSIYNISAIRKFRDDDIVIFNIDSEDVKKGIYSLITLNPSIKSIIFDKNNFYQNLANKDMLNFLGQLEKEINLRIILINSSPRKFKRLF